MAKITKVEAFGLWSHYESVFEFSPGLTIITGNNDTGKSALIRIIKWIFLGEPSGEKFIFEIRDDQTKEIIKKAEEGKAVIHLDNGIVISKTRRSGRTIYEHSAFSEPFITADVPCEIQKSLGIKKNSFGDFETCLNFAFQLEAPFLLSESASTGAKVLGTLAGTEAVDLAIKDVSGDTYKAREEKRAAQKAIEKINESLLPFQDLDDKVKKLKDSQKLMDELDEKLSRFKKMEDYKEKYVRIYKEKTALTAFLIKFKPVPELIEMLNVVISEEKRKIKLIQYETKYCSLVKSIKGLSDELLKFKDLERARDLKDISANLYVKNSSLKLINAKYFKLDFQVKELNKILDKLTEVPSLLSRTRKLEIANSKFQFLMKLDTKHNTYITNLRAADKILSELLQLDKALTLSKDIDDYLTRLERLRPYNSNYLLLKDLNNKLDIGLKNYMELDFVKTELELKEKTILRLEGLKLLTLKNIVANTKLEEKTYELSQAHKCFKLSHKELDAAWDEAGGICPLCESEVKN